MSSGDARACAAPRLSWRADDDHDPAAADVVPFLRWSQPASPDGANGAAENGTAVSHGNGNGHHDHGWNGNGAARTEPISWRAEDATATPPLSWRLDFDDPMLVGVAPNDRAHRVLLHGSAWLIVNVAIAALGSFIFWLAAARVETARAVGVAAALFTAMMFVNYVTGLGLPIAISRYAAGPGAVPRALFAWSIVATVASSVVGVVGLVALVPGTVQPLLDAVGLAAGGGLFLVLVIGISVSVLVDARLITLRRWGWVLTKGVAGVVLRFPLLLGRPAGTPGIVLFLCAAVPPALVGYVSAVPLLGRDVLTCLRAPLPSSIRAAVHFSAVNYVGQLAVQGPPLVLPLIAIENVTKTEYASFYIAFSIAAVVFVVPLAIGQVLLAEGGLRGASLAAQTRYALRLSLAAVALATLLSPLGAKFITIAYGASYRSAADLLTPLVAAGLAWCFTTMYLTEARVREDTPGTVAISISFPVATLLPALVLAAAYGLTGLALSWIIGNVFAMCTALIVHRHSGIVDGRRLRRLGRKEVVLHERW